MKQKLTLISITTIIVILGCAIMLSTEIPEAESHNYNLAESLYAKVNPSEDTSILMDFYANVGDFSNDYILAIGIKSYLSQNSEEVTAIPEAEVAKNIYEIFGKNISYENSNVSLLSGNYCTFYYNEETKIYYAQDRCHTSTLDFFYRTISNIEIDNDNIYVYEKSIYVYREEDLGFNHVSIYDNVVAKNLIKSYEDNPENPAPININDYLNEASTYKYTFTKENGDFIFKGIELLK
ncbi:MAG: hypothetical protein K2J20_01545 [Bacilli bacterium]|nr:hypothetical protein [Bacilli bacterium]